MCCPENALLAKLLLANRTMVWLALPDGPPTFAREAKLGVPPLDFLGLVISVWFVV